MSSLSVPLSLHPGAPLPLSLLWLLSLQRRAEGDGRVITLSDGCLLAEVGAGCDPRGRLYGRARFGFYFWFCCFLLVLLREGCVMVVSMYGRL